MLYFLVHLSCLLIQLLNSSLSWPDLSLQLLDLVIKHKLELLKLLCPLIQLGDLLLFVSDCCVTFVQLTLLTLLKLALVCLVIELSVQLLLHLIDPVLEAQLLSILVTMVILNQRQAGLLMHALINLVGEFLLILLLDSFNFFPPAGLYF